MLSIILALSVAWGSTANASTFYALNNVSLDFHTSSPPALIYVEDSENNISGADPNKGLDGNGQGSDLQGIPNSFVEQDNIGADTPDGKSGASPFTGWTINILNPSQQLYFVHLDGVSNGVCELWITGLYAASLKIPKIRNTLEILTSNGSNREIRISFDSTKKSLVSTPIVNPGDLLADTQSACGLGDIGPASACEALEAFAAAVQKAIVDNKPGLEKVDFEIYLSILNRLHFWGKDGNRHDWDEFKNRSECDNLRKEDLGGEFFVKDPSYFALKLDADTLLSGWPKDHDK